MACRTASSLGRPESARCPNTRALSEGTASTPPIRLARRFGLLTSVSMTQRRVALGSRFLWLIIAGDVAYDLDARAQSPFTEEALQRGVNYPIAFNHGAAHSFGEGVAFADLDGDWDPDLITVGRWDGVVGLFENDGSGYFTDLSATSAIPQGINHSGVTAADFDGDQDVDLFLANWLQPNLLLRNDGDFAFTDVTAKADMGDAGAGTGCAWGDYDGDGRLDVYLSNRTDSGFGGGGGTLEENRLYHNLGGGQFEEVAESLGVQDPGAPTFQAVFFDFDWDGDADLYLSTDKGYADGDFRNHLFENQGGAFVEITDKSGTGASINSMGVAVGDFDVNGFQDLYCTNTLEGNPLYLNQGDGTFVESSALAGVQSFAFGWGAVFYDYDNNSFLDLYVCNITSTNRFYVYNGAWPAVNLAVALAVADQGLSYGVAVADIDNDGDLDMAVQNENDRTRLYINHQGETRNWARLNVIGQGSNFFAIGARVAVRTGKDWRIREIIAGSNYKSQNELTVHVGVDLAETLDEVFVTWPGGASRTLLGLAANRTWFIVPPEQLGDIDGDGAVTPADITPFVAVLVGAAADPVAAARADLGGNGLPDGGDIGPFVALLLL